MISEKIYNRFWPFIIALTFVWALVFVDQIYAKGGDIQGRRVALIVGNSNYKSVYSLKNAVSDSASVAAVLSRLGFEVIEVSDVTKVEFSKVLDKFSAAAQDAEAAVFYYSGHGFQLGGSNFLVPIDAKLNNRKTILQETLRLNDVIKAVQDRNRQTLIFLDACRNNPLPESVRDKSMIDGLAQLDAGTGTFVAFATQPGNITRDGAGDHSPFAAALIEHMETPGISISDMMIRVRNSVEVATLQTQTPWDQSSLRNQFYFSPEEQSNADLTEEDKALLLSLPPALRKKFAAQFGIKFGDDGVILSQSVRIKRRFSIAAGGNDTPEAPAVKKKPGIQDRFIIAAGDSNETPVVVVSLDSKKTKSSKPILAPLDEELQSSGAGFIPLPNFRPGVDPVEEAKDQLVASLAPSDTKPEIAQRIDLSVEPEFEPETNAETETVPSATTKPEVTPKAAGEAATQKQIKPAPVEPAQVRPKKVKPSVTPTAPVVADKDNVTVVANKIRKANQPKKPRVIEVFNPELANTSNAKVEPDIQVAINSPTRSVETVQPSTNRSSLRPIKITPKRLIGKEVQTGQPKSKNVEKNVRVAKLQPVVKKAPEPELEELTVAPVGLEDTPQKVKEKKAAAKPEVKVASLGTGKSVNNSKSNENIVPTKEPSITPPSRAFEVQTELARLGCYRSKVDGLWGANSARALFRYYGNKKIAPTELEPNTVLLSMLQNDEVVVCKRTIVKKKRKRKIVTKDTGKKIQIDPDFQEKKWQTY